MPWDRSRQSDPKYKTTQHKREREKWARQLKRDGYLICQQPICLMPSRIIKPGDKWHLGHDDSGVNYIGPVCAKCNVVDGARRGRAKQSAPRGWVV